MARAKTPQIERFKDSMVYHLGWEVFIYFDSELTTPRDSKMDEIIIKNPILMIKCGPVSRTPGERAFDNHMDGNEEESSFMLGGSKFWN